MPTNPVGGGPSSSSAADAQAARAAAERAERERAAQRAAAQAAQERAQQAQQAERDRLFGSGASADPFADLSDGVASDLEQAVQDDVDTLEDLEDAATHVATPADIDALMATAEEAGQDERRVLQAVLRELDEEAEPPQTAMYDAIARHFERLAEPDAAIAARAAGDPAVSVDVRRELTHALQDDTDTGDDLVDAVRAARTPAELAAVMAAQRATGAEEPDHLLREALLALDEEAACANTSLIDAIADEYAVLGDQARADAVRAVADPTLTPEVRKELIHALQDDDDTEEDLEDAFGAATGAGDVAASEAVSRPEVGAEAAREMAALTEVRIAMDAYNAAMEAAAGPDETLAMGLAMMEGMPDARQADFIEAFQARHQEVYQAVDAARAALADAVAANQGVIGEALVRGEAATGEDIGTFEDAVSAVAGAPEAAGAVEAIAIQMLEHAEDVPEARMTWMLDEVAPSLVNAQVSRAMSEFDGDPAHIGATVMSEYGRSDFMNAIRGALGGLNLANTVRSKLDNFASGVDQLSTVFERGSYREVSDALAEKAANSRENPMSFALAGVGVALGVLSWGDRDGWGDLQNGLSTLSNGATVARGALQLFAGSAANPAITTALGRAPGVLGGIASVVGGVRALADGEYVEGAVQVGLGAASVAAAFAPIPGLNAVAAAAAAGMLGYHLYQDRADEQRRNAEVQAVFDEIGLEPEMQAFLASGSPGVYDAVRALGLSHGQIREYVLGGGVWSENLYGLATVPIQTTLLPTLTSNGEIGATIDRLGEGLSDDGVAYAVELVQTVAATIRFRTPPAFSATDLDQAIDLVLPAGGLGADEVERAQAHVRDALNLA